MRTNKLKELIYGEMNCVVCDIAFAKLYEDGLGEFAQAVRQYAETLWTTDGIENENRHNIHEQISGLLRNVSGEVSEADLSLKLTIENLDEAAKLEPRLSTDWEEIKSILCDLNISI